MNSLILAFIISLVVIFIMIKQINSVTDRIDQKSITNEPSVYSQFAGSIQEKIRAIKADIDSSKNTPSPTYTLLREEEEEKSLEFLADTIRKLVFFETMNSKRRSQKEVEKELFELLSLVDDFLKEKVVDGEKIADALRDELFNAFNNIQNRA